MPVIPGASRKIAGLFFDRGGAYMNALHPEFQVKGDGFTNDAVGLKAAEAAAIAAKVPLVMPPTPLGYVIGDGVTNGTGFTSATGLRYIGWNTKIIHRAKQANGNNDLFWFADCSDSWGEGFIIDAESQVRKAVTFKGVVNRCGFKMSHISNCKNFAITFGDTQTDFNLASFDDLTLEDLIIDGEVGLIGDGSGIDIFCRSMDTVTVPGKTLPGGKNLHLNRLKIDVTRGQVNEANHGPQCIKVNNCRGVDGGNLDLRGGDVSCLILTNGASEVTLDHVFSRYASRGLNIDDTNNVSTLKTRNVQISNYSYRQDGVTTTEGYGAVLGGAPEGVKINGFDVDGAIRMISGASAVEDLREPRFMNGTLRGSAGISVVDPGSAWAPIRGGTIENIQFEGPTGPASDCGGRITLGDANRPADGWTVRNVKSYRPTLNVVDVIGSRNVITDIESIDQNPANAASKFLVTIAQAFSLNNSFRDLKVTGAHNVKAFVHMTGGSGAAIQNLTGVLAAGNNMCDFTNQENSDIPQGDYTFVSPELTLSAAANDPIVFMAQEDLIVLGVSVFYTEGSSIDAGVIMRIGKLGSGTATYFSKASEASKALGFSHNYINTSGTDSFNANGRRIAKGDVVTMGTAGLKVGLGKVRMQISLARLMTP